MDTSHRSPVQVDTKSRFLFQHPTHHSSCVKIGGGIVSIDRSRNSAFGTSDSVTIPREVRDL